MSSRLEWDATSKADALRQRNNNNRPPPNDRNPLDSINIPPQISFNTNTSTSSDINNNTNISSPIPSSFKKRYVARLKNICMAIPFDPNQTLLSFQNEVILRASTHRKLQNESKLSKRIQYIKLATPHFPQLVDV